MNTQFPNSYLPLDEDVPLMEPSTSFALVRVWKKYGRDKNIATFDLVVRDLPKNRNFLVFTGLEEIIRSILNWHYSDNHIATLEKYGFLDEATKDFLKNFRFTGSVYAMKEGTIFFPGETVVKIVAPLAEAALFYNFLVNCLCSNTMFATKAARAKIAVGNKKLSTGAIRGHGAEAMLKYMRSAHIVGFDLMVAPVFVDKYKVEYPRLFNRTHHHYMTSFPSEFEAMEAMADVFPDHEVPLIIDTYDVKKGVENAIKVCKEQKAKGGGISAVFIDSGDLGAHAISVREALDKAGFPDVKIAVASNLNEWRIEELVKAGAPIDSYVLATELITSADDPTLEAVYKMAQIEENGVIRPTLKLSAKKKSLPGSKQIYRTNNGDKMDHDVIALDGEMVEGESLLIPMIENGELIYELPSLDGIKNHFAEQLKKLPDNLKQLEVQEPYSVRNSTELEKLIEKVTKGVS